MFKWIEYDTFISKIKEIEQDFTKIDNILNYTSDENTVSILQSKVIDIGNLIERYMDSIGDENRDIISSLEKLCEHIYEWFSCTGSIQDKIEIRSQILADFRSFYVNIRNHRGAVDLAVCTIIRNEARYIEEWIEYHLYFGVKKFYIYDNESTDNILSVLKPYIDDGIVEYKLWPGNTVQLSAYTDAINLHKDDAGYIAFIDADEFLTPVKYPTINETIDEIMLKHFHSGAVGVNWRAYGTSGHEKLPDGLVIENYIYRAENRDAENSHVKVVANPRRVVQFSVNPHEAVMKPGYFCISENGSPVIGPFFYESDCNLIRINHYMSKSKEGFVSKHKRGWPDQPHVMPLDKDIEYKFQIQESKLNAVKDESAKAVAAVIEERIALRKNS